MRFFGGGGRGWNSDKVLILSPMGLEEEWWNFEAGGRCKCCGASVLWFHGPVPVKWCHEHHDTPRDTSALVNIARPKHIVDQSSWVTVSP